MVPFNKPIFVGTELQYFKEALEINRKTCGDGPFTKRCSQWLEQRFDASKVLLTTSGTSALEMAAILCDIKPDDEVILPSYTFSTTATAFSNLGAKLVFIDVRPDTMNIDEQLIEDAITDRTRVIVPVHYAGIACEMDRITSIAQKHGLFIVEDAAQGVMSTYNGKPLGTIGDFGCYSFHETKNYSMGEGGALVINNDSFIERAEIIREKGTNRSRFFRGQVDKYTWVDRGSSYLPSELGAAYLWAQLEIADDINDNRVETWDYYYKALQPLAERHQIELPVLPDESKHNGHLFFLKLPDLDARTRFIKFMNENGVNAVFHYVPLHSSPAGQAFGRLFGEDRYTTSESDRLVRLPLWFGMSQDERDAVVESVNGFFNI